MEAFEMQLEQMIDTHGLSAVVGAMSKICSEKADHVQTNWQDSNTACDWRRASTRLDTTAVHPWIVGAPM